MVSLRLLMVVTIQMITISFMITALLAFHTVHHFKFRDNFAQEFHSASVKQTTIHILFVVACHLARSSVLHSCWQMLRRTRKEKYMFLVYIAWVYIFLLLISSVVVELHQCK
jgi:hypothetical protein